MWHIVSFSGGADSTYLCFYLIENGYPLDEAVMFDTGWEFPQMYAHIEKMRAYLEHHGVRFTVIKPSKSFDYLMFEKEVHKKAERYIMVIRGVALLGVVGAQLKKLKRSTLTLKVKKTQ